MDAEKLVPKEPPTDDDIKAGMVEHKSVQLDARSPTTDQLRKHFRGWRYWDKRTKFQAVAYLVFQIVGWTGLVAFVLWSRCQSPF